MGPEATTNYQRLMQFIALSAACIEHSKPQPTIPDQVRHIAPDDLVHGFIRDNNPENQSRAVRIMDALASICVSEPRSQVIAIGAQLKFKDDAIHIVIASNNDNSLSKAQAHLEFMWKKVQELGSIYARERNKDGSRKKWKNYLKTSPPKPKFPHDIDIEIRRCRKELRMAIVRYSAAKMHQRIMKRWDKFLLFGKAFFAYKKSQDYKNAMMPDEERTAFENLSKIIDYIGRMKKILNAHFENGEDLSDEQVDKLCFALGWSSDLFHLLRGPTAILRCLNRLPSPERHQAFPVQHYIQKVLLLQEHFMTLCDWAYSPRLRRSLTMKISVESITTSARGPMLPVNEKEWKAVVMDVLKVGERVGDTEANFEEKTAKAANERYRYAHYRPRHHRDIPIHCEVAIVQHYHARSTINWPTTEVPPYNYIGVSKLSCSACHFFIRAYGEHTQRRFNTRGTHNKLYYPWGFPNLNNQDLEGKIMSDMLTKVAHHVCAYWDIKGAFGVRPGSDSTIPSDEDRVQGEDQTEDHPSDIGEGEDFL